MRIHGDDDDAGGGGEADDVDELEMGIQHRG